MNVSGHHNTVAGQGDSGLVLAPFKDVVPLSDAFEPNNPKTAPDALLDYLFAPDGPDGGPVNTYAVLDAAKVDGLVELLADSGLAHKCLFKGDAFDELKEVAPWLVKLEVGNSFTRHLFTRSDAPWHLWDAQPGIFVRSTGSMEDMWTHFRKFTKVQDASGAWFYFRYWDRDVQRALVDAHQLGYRDIFRFFVNPQAQQYLAMYFPAIEAALSASEDNAETMQAVHGLPPNAVLAALMPFLERARVHRDLKAIAVDIAPETAAADPPPDVLRMLYALFESGLRKKTQLRRVGEIEIASQFQFLGRADVRALLETDGPDYDRFLQLNEIAAGQGY